MGGLEDVENVKRIDESGSGLWNGILFVEEVYRCVEYKKYRQRYAVVAYEAERNRELVFARGHLYCKSLASEH
jgi:hypothetical protein